MVALVLAMLAALHACSGDNDRPPPCTNCVHPTSGAGGVSTTDGGGGSGGGGGSALASSGGAPQCQGGKGAPMAYVAVDGSSGFCIDIREVTSEEYDVFRLYAPQKPSQEEPCTDNLSWGPSLGDAGTMPRNLVDWCDALAFCGWAGKRLCGRIGGGDVTSAAEAADPTVDEWYHACTNAGVSVYPYGDTFDESICNTHVTSNILDPVQASPDCHGTGDPFGQIFDMSGNVGEWTSYCDPDPGRAAGDQFCYLRGGDWLTAEPLTTGSGRCDYVEKKQRLEIETATMGIRCCKDPELDGG